MAITKFDPATCKALSAEIASAIAMIAQRHGLVAVPAGGRYDTTKYTAKIEFRVTDADAVFAKEKADFDQYCGWYGLTPNDHGLIFSHGGQSYRLTGFAPNRAKPIVATRLSNNTSVIFATGIVAVIKAAAATKAA